MTDSFTTVLAANGLILPPEQIEVLDRYCRLLWEWNEKLNLTRHTDYQKFVTRDLVDSLTLAQFLSPGERVLDVGTGGGVPGVVLAVLRPDLTVELCESVGKRARAVTDIVRQLGLAVPMREARAEELLTRAHYNTLVVRAVARMEKLLEWFRPHWEHFDRMLLVKGPAWVAERGEARHVGLLNDLALRKLHEYPLPGTESASVILQICPKDRLTDERTCPLRDLSRPPAPQPPTASRPKSGARGERRGVKKQGKWGKGKPGKRAGGR